MTDAETIADLTAKCASELQRANMAEAHMRECHTLHEQAEAKLATLEGLVGALPKDIDDINEEEAYAVIARLLKARQG